VSDAPEFTVIPEFEVIDAPVIDRAAVANRQAVKDHYKRSRGVEIKVADPDEAPDTIPEYVEADADDLAAVVVRKTRTLLAAGKMTPTLRDGLTAQQLLDRRAEKAADRRFMLNLAMAMAGGGVETPQKLLPPGEDAIEGGFSEVELAPEHLRRP
jgi:hypothetical protein